MLENAFFTNASEKYHISHELAGELQLDINNYHYLTIIIIKKHYLIN